jgi:hypothetical protein
MKEIQETDFKAIKVGDVRMYCLFRGKYTFSSANALDQKK